MTRLVIADRLAGRSDRLAVGQGQRSTSGCTIPIINRSAEALTVLVLARDSAAHYPSTVVPALVSGVLFRPNVGSMPEFASARTLGTLALAGFRRFRRS
jgi:hypothetical protein